MRYPPEPRRRTSRLLILLIAVAAVLLVLVGLGAAYQVGSAQSQARIDSMLGDVAAQHRLITDLSRRAASAEQAATAARAAAPPSAPAPAAQPAGPPTADGAPPQPVAAAPTASAPEAPATPGEAARPLAMSPDEMQTLVGAIQARMERGVPVGVLVQAINAVPDPGGCVQPTREERIFLARTPVTRDPSTASFLNGRIKVAGSGVSVKAANGLPEAWYDQAQPVALTITVDGKSIDQSGVLPLRTDLTLDDKAYHLEAANDDKRGFVAVTLSFCP